MIRAWISGTIVSRSVSLPSFASSVVPRFLALPGWGFGLLELLSALVFSAAFLGEALNGLELVGAGLILGGAAFGELFHPKQLLSVSSRGPVD